MKMRPRRRNLVVWSSSAAPAGRSGHLTRTQLARGGRICWWFRTGTLLTVIGVMRLAQVVRVRRRDAFLVAGTLLTVLSIALGSLPTFFCGMLVWVIARPWHWDEKAGS
jgi:hypothetical protein